MKFNIYLLILSLYCLGSQLHAANRYWVSAGSSNWNNTTNWSTSSGGTGGASVPTNSDVAFFNNNGLGNCIVDVAVDLHAMDIASTYTGTINLNGQSFIITGASNSNLDGGTIDNTGAASTFSVNSSAITIFDGTTFQVPVNVISNRIQLNGSIFNNVASFEQNGTTGANSTGGNTFTENVTITNSGGSNFILGTGSADNFQKDLTLLVSGNTSARIDIGNGSAGNIIGGDLIATNSGTGSNTNIYLATNTGSSIAIGGNATFLLDGSATSQRTYIANNGTVTIGGVLNITNSSTGENTDVYLANGTTSSCTITGTTTVVNNNTSIKTNRIYLGNNGDVTFNGLLSITNNSAAPNSQVYCHHNPSSSNIYNENIEVRSTNTSCDGIYFGASGGSGTLAATKIVTIPGGGATNFVGGDLYFRNFTQTGATAQTILVGTTGAYIYNYDSDWGGNVDFRAPRMYTRGTTYRGTTYLEKTGTTGNDDSYGGNTFVGDLTLVNSGSNRVLFGGTVADDFQGNVTMNNVGTTSYMYLAHNAPGNSIVGNLTITNSATGTAGDVYIAGNAVSNLSITGNVTITQNGSANRTRVYLGTSGDMTISGDVVCTNAGIGTTGSEFYIGNSDGSIVDIIGGVTINQAGSSPSASSFLGNVGDVNVGGNVTFSNLGTGARTDMYIANNQLSSVNIGGNTTITNGNTGVTNQRVYLGNNGDVAFTGTLDIINESSVNNSQVYCNYNANSVNTYGDNITVQSTHTSCDGVSFGRNGGQGTLATTRTISIPGGGAVNFIGGELYFRNFIQTGAATQTLALGSTATYIYNYDSDWGGDVDFRAPRMYTRGTTYSRASYLEKTGGIGDDYSAGGNTFTGDAIIVNSGSRLIALGNGASDTFQANVNLNNTGSSSIILAHNTAGHTITGNVIANNSGTGTTTRVYLANQTSATLSIGGDVTFTQNSSATNTYMYLGENGDVTVGGDFTATNSGTGTNSEILVARNANSSVTITGITSVTNANTATNDQRIYLGNNGDVNFVSDLSIINASGAPNSHIYSNHGANSINNYGGNVTVQSTNVNCDGVLFGRSGGQGTLATTRTISIPGGSVNFIGGELYFRNFTQLGTTDQTLEVGSTGTYIYIYDCRWEGDVDFRAPRMYTRGTTYNRTTYLEKTGGIGDDYSPGGNTFVGDATIANSGSRTVGFGNGTIDAFQANVTANNTGTASLILAHRAAGHTIAGNLIANNSGTGTTNRLYISNQVDAALSIGGNVTFTQNSSATNTYMYLGENGDVTVGGDFTATNGGTGTNSEILVARNTNSSVSITGNTSVTNANTASGTQRIYLANNGDINFTGDVTIINASGASNSQIYCNHASNSVNTYGGNITVQSTNVNCDGINFGRGQGQAVLAATRTISVAGGSTNFIGGELYLRNFTQTGVTTQTIALGSTATYIYNYDSNWGGDISFTAPRIYTRGTTYNRTTYLEKTGGIGADYSAGGNTFTDDLTFVNSGTQDFAFGNGTADAFGADVIMNNTGTASMILANSNTGHMVTGNVIATNSGTGTTTRIYLSNNTNAGLTIGGNLTVTQNGSSTNTYCFLGRNGDLTVNGDFTATNGGTGNISEILVANGDNSLVNIGGNTNVTNANTAASNQFIYLGNYGDINFTGDLAIVNESAASNSRIYCNDRPASFNSYGGNITVQATNTACDEMNFGRRGGQSTLAANRTITIPGGGAINFIGGELYLRNFTQTGTTAQSLTLGSTATYIYNYDSNWGGNVDFRSPRVYTRGTTYSGTTYLEKTGTGDDASAGGNTFVGDATFVNSGSRYFLLGNGTADDFQSNVTMNNTGTYRMYIGHRGTGHVIEGDLTITNSGTGIENRVYIAENSAGGITIKGDLMITQNSSATNAYSYIGNNGDVTINGDVTCLNQGTGTNSEFFIAPGANSTVVIGGNTSLTNSNTATTTQRIYFGSNGDITQTGTLDILNQSGASNSQVYCNHSGNGVNTYGGDITIQVTNTNCDGIFFGNGSGQGTLAAGRTISIPGGVANYIGGQLYFRNFTQTGATAQTLALGATATYLYNYDSNWGGDVSFTASRLISRGTTYDGNVFMEKNGASNDYSNGGNTYNGSVEFVNSSTSVFGMGNGISNDFNGDVTFTQTSTGRIIPSNNEASTYAGNININHPNSQIYFHPGGNARTILDGTDNQSINDLGTSITPLFRDFQINKASGSVTLNMPIEIVSEIDLDQGIVYSTTTNLITMRDNSIVSSASDLSYVDGPIEKIGNDAFTFPVGDNAIGKYRPIGISAPSNGSARFRASYTGSNYSSNDIDTSTGLDRVSGCEYWILDRISSSNSVAVTLSWDTFDSGECSDVQTPTELVVARYNGSNWESHGNVGVTGSATAGTVTSNAISNFSPFTLGSTTRNNTLPVEFLNFEAVLAGDVVDVVWQTASEINNDFFIVEKSQDGENFYAINQVEGVGNTQEISDYFSQDIDPLDGVSYYRLKQVDFDGTTSYSSITKINSSITEVSVYPNPAKSYLTIQGIESELENIQVLNGLGQDVTNLVVITNQNSTKLNVDVSALMSGVYTIKTLTTIHKIHKK